MEKEKRKKRNGNRSIDGWVGGVAVAASEERLTPLFAI
jgi:hypothetical protein